MQSGGRLKKGNLRLQIKEIPPSLSNSINKLSLSILGGSLRCSGSQYENSFENLKLQEGGSLSDWIYIKIISLELKHLFSQPNSFYLDIYNYTYCILLLSIHNFISNTEKIVLISKSSALCIDLRAAKNAKSTLSPF